MAQHRGRRDLRQLRRRMRSSLLAVPVAMALVALSLPATGEELAVPPAPVSATPSDEAPSPEPSAPEPAAPEPEGAPGGAKPEPSPEPSESAAEPDDPESADDSQGQDAPDADPQDPAASKSSEGLIGDALNAVLAAGPETLTLTLKQQTGTEPFTPGDDSAGKDSDANNNIIRTNDTVTYDVGVRYEGGDQTNPTIKFTLPRGQELVSLPPFCLAGSGVSPAALPAPTVPVTPTSWETLPIQDVTCVVKDRAVGTSLDYRFVAKVRSEVPNGTALTPVVATATSDQVVTPAESGAVSQVVSAAANFDVSKRAMSTTDTTGPLGGVWGVCSFDPSRSCRVVDYPLTINAPTGGKGITPLASPITLKDDLRPDSFYGPGTTSSDEWLAAGPGAMDKYAPRMTICDGRPLNVYTAIPNPRIVANSTSTSVNSVRDNGTTTCTSAGPGTVVDLTITNADTTGYTVPSRASGGAALTANSGYVVSLGIRVEIPVDAVRDLGQEVGGVQTLNFTNAYTDIEAVDISGAPNRGEVLENNVRKATATLATANGHFAKGFSGVPGTPRNTGTGTGGFSAWEYEGPPGSGTFLDGNTVVVPGQTVLSNLLFSEEIPPHTGTELSTSRMMCDVWDNTKLAMPTTFDLAGRTYTRVQRPSGGSPAWVSSFQFANLWQTSLAQLDNYRLEYGYTPTPGNGASSSCADGVWADSPGEVSGATQVDGTWRGVNRVRVSFSTKAASNSTIFSVNLSIAMRALATAGPTGTVLPNWASLRTAKGVKTMEGILADPSATSALSSYVPANHTGARGDRLTLGAVAARIKKYVKNPSTDEFTDTAVPQYSAGSLVDYRLNPSLTADVSASVQAPVFVEDCLPRYQVFLSSKRGNGDPISPAVISDGAPAGAEIACPAPQTYLKWELGQHTVNEPIDPIIYSVEILETVRNGNYINTTAVSTPGDPSRLTARTDTAQIQIVTPTGVAISKRVNKPVIEVNPVGVQTPRTLKWTVHFANVDSPLDVSDVDVIDVLPADGLFGSDFTGTLRLDSTAVVAGDDIEFQYTKRAPADLRVDPDDASNAADGSTVWCSAASDGTVKSGSGSVADCPASAAEVTGLRFLRAGDFDPTDELAVDIFMTPVGNAGGDVYENRTGGRAAGVTQPVGPAIRTSRVIESSVGNVVWEDVDKDGIQDEDEPGVARFPVRLTGEDLDGNPVELTTETDDEGAYEFTGLASGTYRVTFDPNGLTSNTTFTVQDAGDDDAADSDGDPVSGESAEFTLDPDSADPSWDQGLIIDRFVDITVDKQFVGQTELDSANRATVTYDLVVANAGTAEGVYDLADQLKFGGSIVIDGVSSSNLDPGDLEVNPDFDGIGDTTLVEGQVLPGGATHVYRVEVDATVNTAISAEQRDCTLTETEEGTGFLNEAQLTVDEVTTTDIACGSPEQPTSPPAVSDGDESDDKGTSPAGETRGGILPRTGGPAWWLTLLGFGALLVGGVVAASRRRGEAAVDGP